ncbi:DUF3489 domain-containing protein [Methylocystis sp.]|uniref:DUF3489 domain-containing protein n=1 Tax=Methylocystis sp. TaxID=1911079 RepID=UPI003DA69C23
MSTDSLKRSRATASTSPKRAASKKRSAEPNAAARSKVTPDVSTKPTLNTDETRVERVTKQERVLTLLGRTDGASIEEIMLATDWQQHSVRGFLAGTVKRKLGFPLTSSKTKEGTRRYRIEKRHAR